LLLFLLREFFLGRVLGLFFFVGQVLDERALPDPVSIIVHHEAIVVDCLSDEVLEITFCEDADELAVCVSHFALFVDLSP
jgi:hypothetical protein